MKKITLITAAFAALAAATVAAQTGDHTTDSVQPELVVASLQFEDTALRGTTRNTQQNNRADVFHVRYVDGKAPYVKSCEQAAWPYYPVDCLQREQQAGL